MSYPNELLVELIMVYPSLSEHKDVLVALLNQESIKAKIQNDNYEPMRLIRPDWIKDQTGNLLRSISEINEDYEAYTAIFERNPKEFKDWIELKNEVHSLTADENLNLNRKKAIDIFTRLSTVVDFISSIPTLNDEFNYFYRLLTHHMTALEKSLEVASRRYFTKYFNEHNKDVSEITFNSKASGEQFGAVIEICYTDKESKADHTIHFYCKVNHLSDELDNRIDPKEIFNYKLLEFTGNGVKSHFISDETTKCWLFIATQDASFTKDVTKIKKFTLYEQLEDKKDRNLQLNIAITRNEIISRILQIDDVMNNFNNFGVVTVNKVRVKWKIIDFSVRTRVNYKVNNIFEGFSSHVGMYKYSGEIKHALTMLPPEEQALIFSSLLDEFNLGKQKVNSVSRKIPLIEAINKAFLYTLNLFAERANIYGSNSTPLDFGILIQKDVNIDEDIIRLLDARSLTEIGDFGRYVKAVYSHSDSFLKGLRGYNPKSEEEKDNTQSDTLSASSQALVSFFKEQSRIRAARFKPSNPSTVKIGAVAKEVGKKFNPSDS